MSSYILEYISTKPIHGLDSASMDQWKLDCEVEWEGMTEFLNIESSPLIKTVTDAHCDLAEKVSQKVYSSLVWSVEDRKKNIAALLEKPQVEQRTESWYQEAQKMLTASQFATILQTGRTRGLLVVDKATGNIDTSQRRTVVETMELNPFTWGIRFEPIVKQIYCDLTKTVVKDMGRLKHSTDTRLAASPDGMVIEGPDDRLGRFVEFKAPVTRILKKIIPKEYVTQMQIQMEVGNVEECDYFEVKFSSKYNGKTPEESETTYYGEIHVITNEEKLRYEYSPLNTKGWLPTLDETERIIETVKWGTSDYYLTTVGRSRSWFESVQPAIESFWKDVQATKDGTFILPVSSRKRKAEACKFVDDE